MKMRHKVMFPVTHGRSTHPWSILLETIWHVGPWKHRGHRITLVTAGPSHSLLSVLHPNPRSIPHLKHSEITAEASRVACQRSATGYQYRPWLWYRVWSITAEFAAVLSSHGCAVGHIDIHFVHSWGGLRIHPFCQSRILIDRDPVPRVFLSCHATLTCRYPDWC